VLAATSPTPRAASHCPWPGTSTSTIAPGTRSSSILAINAGRSCAANSGADPGSGAGEDDDPDTAVDDPADELSAPQAELTRPTKAAVAPASHAAERRLLFRRPVKDIADS